MNHRPGIELVTLASSPEEAAAVIAAVERFRRDTAPPPAAAKGAIAAVSPWRQAALQEGVSRRPGGAAPLK